jgi:membrane protease YdiL (CAAX protease family)
VDWQELIISGLAWLALAVLGAVMLTAWWFYFHVPGVKIRWCPLKRRRRISWYGMDIVLCFFIFMGTHPLVHEFLKQIGVFDWLYGEIDTAAIRGRKSLWSICLAQPLAVALILLGLHCVRGTRLAELGLAATRIFPNVTLGYLFWLVVTPAALVLFWVALHLTPPAFKTHHWVEEITKQPLWPVEWVLLFLITVVLAPIVEELQFRGILFPWQLRRSWDAQASIAFFALAFAAFGGIHIEPKQDDPFESYNVFPVVFVLAMLPGLFLLPNLQKHPQLAVAVPAMVSATPSDGPPQMEKRIAEVPWSLARPSAQSALAIYTNGLLFAAMHSSVWPSPIPLFLLGLGLAWLKWRTTSLVGCITLHALFNAVAFLEVVFDN